MILVYLRNEQLDKHADFIAGLRSGDEGVGIRNPDYWNGETEDRANAVYTDFPHILGAYRAAGIDTFRISAKSMSLEELARIKGAEFERKGSWYYINGEPVQGENKARQTLERL